MRELLVQRTFIRFWFAASISQFGSMVTFLAMPLAVYDFTGSATAFAGVLAAQTAGLVVAMPLGGVLADRYDRVLLIRLGCLLEALLVAFLGLAVHEHQVAPLVVVSFLAAGTGGMFASALPALMRDIIPSKHRNEANALVQLAISTSHLGAPAVGAAMYLAIGFDWVIAFDVATFVVAAMLSFRGRDIPRRGHVDRDVPFDGVGAVHQFARDVRSGLVAARDDRFVLRTLAANLVFGFGCGCMLVAMVPWIDTVLEVPVAWYGAYFTVVGAAGVLAALVLARIGGRISAPRIIVTASIMGMVGSSGFIGAPPLPMLLIAASIFGAVKVGTAVASQTLLQERVPSALQGRIQSMFAVAPQLAQLVGVLVAGVMITLVDPRVVMLVFAVALIATGACQLAAVRAVGAGPTQFGRD